MILMPIQAKCKKGSWRDKYNVISLSQKKNEIMPSAATWMDLKMIILSEVSQTEKDKYHRISLMCGI